MNTERLRYCLAAVMAVMFAGAVLAQTQTGQQSVPTFRVGVDLVPVDVNVIDRGGRPVRDLQASDFVLTIDGQPRRIASAEYVSTMREAALPSPPRSSHYSSNAAAAGGRLIMLVVDQGNIGAGRGRFAMEAARRFIAQLTPADRVGLAGIPAGGTIIEFTSNHAVVAAALQKIVGRATTVHPQYQIGLAEAARIERGDSLALSEFLARACAGIKDSLSLEVCKTTATNDARSLYAMARERARSSMGALRDLMQRLSATPATKTIVFISEALVVDHDRAEMEWVASTAARGQFVIYVLQLESPGVDASSAWESPTRSGDRVLAEEGLDLLAGLARGAVLRTINNADAAFSRLALEMSGYYLLSFEPDGGDRDGKPHRIKIEVPGRSGIEIRARSEFRIDGSRAKTDEEMLSETLRSPLLASEIGLKLSTYTLRDTRSDKLRIVIAAEIDRSANPSGSLSLAYVLMDSKGTVVASHLQPRAPAAIGGTPMQRFLGNTSVDHSGVHTLKLAVVDDRGNRGSVEHTFSAQLASAGQIRAADLLLVENRGTGNTNMPAVSGEVTADILHGYLELYSDDPDVLNDATVVLEVATSEDGRPLDAATARLQPASTESPDTRTAEAAVPIALLPPGNYVARAVISSGGRKAGQVMRPFRITRAVTDATDSASGTATRPLPPSRSPIRFASRIDKFERPSVLTPEVVGFFLDRINFGPGGVGPAAPAIEHARAGRFNEGVSALAGLPRQSREAATADAANTRLASEFLTGLDLYAKGQLEPAAGKFRETLKLDSEFFPAAFYLGACYAAGGRDKEAVGAWQTSLVTESDAPFIYTLLGDALLRLRNVDQALDILTEAAGLWPADDQVQLRLATALTMGGRAAEALAILEPYLQRNPGDHERHFIALRAIYETRAAGRSVKSPDEDRALFARYAEAYSAASGPQQALVEEWRKFIQKK